MARGLVVGRFQPFHRGHLEVVQDVAQGFDALILGIGSSQESHTRENPFTAGERYLMIRRALRDAGVGNVEIIPIPDLHRNALWVRHVETLVPPFDVFFTNNGLPKRLFEEAGYQVRPLPFHERDRFSGTRIRRLLREGGDWEPLVPKAVARTIKQVDGPARLQDVETTDAPEDAAGGS